MPFHERLPRALVALPALAMEAAIAAAFIYAPAERVMGPVQRIFYFPCAGRGHGVCRLWRDLRC